jgi:hypothetical protein
MLLRKTAPAARNALVLGGLQVVIFAGIFVSGVCEFVSDVGVNNHDDSNFTQQASVGCSPALLVLLVGRARLRPLVLAVPPT